MKIKFLQGDSFETILKDKNIEIKKVKEFTSTASKKINEDSIYSKRSTKLDIIENGDNFLLYFITNQYDREPDLRLTKLSKMDYVN